jgi:hypothetical protein
VVHHFHHDGCVHHDVCTERPISRQPVWDNDVSNEMIMMSFLRGRVVYVMKWIVILQHHPPARARLLCRGVGVGQMAKEK